MKKLIIILLLFPLITKSQSLIGEKNIIKTNIFGDAISNYNITYERSILKKMSFSVGVRYMPKMGMPQFVKDKVESTIDNKNVRISDFQMGNFAITPEVRFYLGRGKMRGFYIAPYVRYASFDLQVPMTYDYYPTPGSTEKASALFTGTFTSLSGGILIGRQFQIAKKLVLDFWIIGGHYGTSNGTIVASNFSPSIDKNNPVQTKAFDDQLKDINSKDYGPFKFHGEVNSDYTRATFTSTGAWAGVRALSLSLGFRF